MLTSTYSLIAITAENDRARGMLARMRQHFHSIRKGIGQIDFGFIEGARQRLAKFDGFFRRRKVEQYLMPVMRMMGREAQLLVTELEALSARARALLEGFQEQVRHAPDARARSDAMQKVVDGYCASVSCRLEREERELLPLARRLLSVEDWFSIGAQMLADDSRSPGRRRCSIALPRGASPAIRRVAGMR